MNLVIRTVLYMIGIPIGLFAVMVFFPVLIMYKATESVPSDTTSIEEIGFVGLLLLAVIFQTWWLDFWLSMFGINILYSLGL